MSEALLLLSLSSPAHVAWRRLCQYQNCNVLTSPSKCMLQASGVNLLKLKRGQLIAEGLEQTMRSLSPNMEYTALSKQCQKPCINPLI